MIKYRYKFNERRGGFMGYIKGEERTQSILFPESIDDYISEDNSVRVIEEYI
jgi:hypothetical protein